MTAEVNLPAVSMRAMEPEDLDLLYRIENDRELWGVGATNVPYSRYTLHDYIARATGDIYTDRQVRLIIENAAGMPVGIIDLMNFDPTHRRAEIGIVIQRAYRRQGFAQAVLADVRCYSTRVLHLHQLFAVVGCANEAALHLFRTSGYTESARLRDWLFDGQAYHDAVVMQKVL